MKFFIDTADVNEIREANAMGILDGVTTNPSLVAKTGKKFREVLESICEVVKGPVSAEVVALEHDGMMKEARELSKIHSNIVVKVPMTAEGLKAVKTCVGEGIPTNVTLCFSANQALFAALAGAYIISPFIGRLDDISVEGLQVVRETVEIYRQHHLSTLVLAASIRGPRDITDAARAGADIATVPWKVLQAAARHPLTEKGIEAFLKDWESFQRR